MSLDQAQQIGRSDNLLCTVKANIAQSCWIVAYGAWVDAVARIESNVDLWICRVVAMRVENGIGYEALWLPIVQYLSQQRLSCFCALCQWQAQGIGFMVSFIPYTARYTEVCALLKLRFNGSRRIMKLFQSAGDHVLSATFVSLGFVQFRERLVVQREDMYLLACPQLLHYLAILGITLRPSDAMWLKWSSLSNIKRNASDNL